MPLRVLPGHISYEALIDGSMDRTGAGSAVGGVTADNCFGRNGTIFPGMPGQFRSDRQNSSVTEQNIQIQKNGNFPTGTKTSIAGVLIPKALEQKLGGTRGTGPDVVRAKQRQSELTHAIHSALTQSVGSWTVVGAGTVKPVGQFQFFKITGDFSA